MSKMKCKCGNPAKILVNGEGRCWYCYRKQRGLSIDTEKHKPKDENWPKNNLERINFGN